MAVQVDSHSVRDLFGIQDILVVLEVENSFAVRCKIRLQLSAPKRAIKLTDGAIRVIVVIKPDPVCMRIDVEELFRITGPRQSVGNGHIGLVFCHFVMVVETVQRS